MKTKILSILFGIILTYFLVSFNKQQTVTALLLTNAKTNKSLNICEKTSVQKVEAVLGKAISLDKEIPYGEEEPIYTFKFDGLMIDLQNEKIKNVTISNQKWKLNTVTVGIPVEKMSPKFERSEFNYLGNPRFNLKGSKVIIYAEIDKAQIVKTINAVL